ncbi:hypothetical protein BPOR_0578g00070 [Botrytis porri]|uniref:Uncharacterized protein n=1 Tax=Botrytis porri TaxID=87229 RepID=A0A4Z1KEM6_9HELO|nr:hypothetical protein BPOR_0578g00070 [Botrytis porri]
MAPVLPLSPDKMTLNFISDANTSDESTSASSFYPSHTSQSPYAQVAYQQHGSNHIDSHSPTLSYPSSSVQNQGIHSMGRNKSSDLDNMRTVAIDQLCSISFPSIISNMLTTSNIFAAYLVIQIATRGMAQKQKPSVIGFLFTVLVRQMLGTGTARSQIANVVLECSREATSTKITVIDGMGHSPAST